MNLIDARFTLQVGKFSLKVDLQLHPGRITALLGPSGSGKTTVLRVLAGLEKPRMGRIQCGEDLWYAYDKRVWRRPQQRHAGVVFQDYALFEHYTVTENIGYGVTKARRQAQVQEWLERLHLTHVAAHYPAQLSGGQRQRTALGRALAISPKLLLLDEPFSAVDFALRHRLRVELRELVDRSEFPVLLVSHDLDEVRQLASHVYVIDEGEILQSGPTEQIFAQPETRRVAQIAGWKNILPLRAVRSGVAQGDWGEMQTQLPDKRGGWLGARPEHLTLVPDVNGAIRAHVRHITDFGSQKELTLVTDDGTHLYLLQTWRHVVPDIGEQIALRIAPEYLRYWPDTDQTVI